MASSTSIPVSTASLALTPPPLVALRPYYVETSYASFQDDQTAVLAEGVFSPRVRIAVEYANKIDPNLANRYVNLRFCYSNRYIGRNPDSVIPIAQLLQPDEDTTSTTSTLFELSNLNATYRYRLCHVQSGTYLGLNGAHDTLLLESFGSGDPASYFELVDWQGIVKLPEYLAFKGSNGKYLKGYIQEQEGNPYLQFSSDDPNSEDSVHEVELQSDGHVKIRSLFYDRKYWRNSICWIRPDSQDSSTTNTSLRYWPVKLDETTIALRSALNDQFCVNLTLEGKDSCLDAWSPTITTDAHLVVQELVSNRKLYNVSYRMADARIFNERPYVAGSTTADNETDQEASIAVSLTYTDSTSYTFSNSTSLTAGVTSSIEANLLEIIKESIQVSLEVTESFESGKTTTTEKSITATGTVTVPPKTKATVYYVGTLGTCDVPFSYTRQDSSSSGGSNKYTDEDDGIYTGINAYNFSFTFNNPTVTL